MGKLLANGGEAGLAINLKRIFRITPLETTPDALLDYEEFTCYKVKSFIHLLLWFGGIAWLFLNNESFQDLSAYEYLVIIAVYIFKPDISYFSDIFLSYSKYKKKFEQKR